MKIGFYGGVANNMYVMAHAFARQRHDVLYIRDPVESFPFSQPVWEDAAFTLEYEDVADTAWNISKWHDFEKEHGWKASDWIVEDCKGFKSTIEKFKECDVLIVCGIRPAFYASFSGVPYVIWPHGADIRFAAGLDKDQGTSLKRKIYNMVKRLVVDRAFRQANFIGTHDPKGIGGDIGSIPYDICHFPIPLCHRPRNSDKAARHTLFKQTLGKLGIDLPSSEHYIFIPSRIDYEWKGTDRLINAIAESKGFKNCHFIFAGWGNDYEDARFKLSTAQATFLPCAVSKPILFDLFSGADLVIDQFVLGTYGTSAIEAMSCGTPVMMSIDDAAFEKKKWAPPPVLNACAQDEIAQILSNVDSGNLNLDSKSTAIEKWFLEMHEESIVIKDWAENLKQISGAS